MEEEKIYRTYTAEILRFYAENHGAQVQRYTDILSGNVANSGEKTADTIKSDILSEFERLGGGERGN
ncbi:MAG: hypothetical protein J6Y64_09245 [Ruminococcus sp.]|nr:hypothetical protein [Ruminococcus sp.]